MGNRMDVKHHGTTERARLDLLAHPSWWKPRGFRSCRRHPRHGAHSQQQCMHCHGHGFLCSPCDPASLCHRRGIRQQYRHLCHSSHGVHSHHPCRQASGSFPSDLKCGGSRFVYPVHSGDCPTGTIFIRRSGNTNCAYPDLVQPHLLHCRAAVLRSVCPRHHLAYPA